MTTVAGEPVIRIPQTDWPPKRVVYAPELLQLSLPSVQIEALSTARRPSQSLHAAIYGRGYFETLFATQPDPWKYTTAYEQTKYEQTLALIPLRRIRQALEIACAEGHFTVRLASRVGRLLAADVSQIALEHAATRCAGLENVTFMRLDVIKDLLPGHFNLIICSEVLYFVGGLEQLESVAHKIAAVLEPGGYLLMAHANLVVDDPDRTGYDWDFPFGAKVIGETFANTPSLRLVKELRTPLYRIQLFRREPRLRFPFRRLAPQIIEMLQPTPAPPRAAMTVLWQGGSPNRGTPPPIVTDRLPILMYHRVAPAGSPGLARYRINPAIFAEQLRYLRDAGYYSVKLEEWQMAMEVKSPLPGRAILISFDDGYQDFFTYAWPLLKEYGFSATVFLVANEVGRANYWDRLYGEEIPLLGWQEIRQLQSEGVDFGAHGASHLPLTGLSPAEIVYEGAVSRAILERELRVPTKAIAYPYGDTDQVVQHLIGACGYIFGLSCRLGRSGFNDPLLALPRIEIEGADGLQQFINKLNV